MKHLLLSYTEIEEKDAAKLAEGLKELGYKTVRIQEKPEDDENVLLLLLNRNSRKEAIEKESPWIKNQFDFSSIPHLKIMPVFLYHPEDGDPEVQFENTVLDIYEELFSGEFKPFAWNLDENEPDKEFLRVLDEYSE